MIFANAPMGDVNPVAATNVVSSVLSTILSAVGVTSAAAPQQAPVSASNEGIFGIPKMIAIVGGAILVAGTATLVLSRRKPRRALAGYKKRKSRKGARR